MEEKRNLQTEEAQANEETTEKGFTAYLKIYGKSKLITEVYDNFEGDPDELDEERLRSIAKYLENISGVPETVICHGVLRIDGDDIDLFTDEED